MRIEVIKPSQIPDECYDSIVGIDIETEDNKIDSPICMISIYKPKYNVIFVIGTKVYRRGLLEEIEEDELEILKDFISRSIFTGANIQFDISRIAYQWGVKPKDIYLDTFLIGRMFQMESCKLKDMALKCEPKLSSVIRHFEDIEGTKPPFVYDIENEATVRYSGLDAYLSFVIISRLAQRIKNYEKVIKVEHNFLRVAIDENLNGLRIDMNKFRQTSADYEKSVEAKLQELRDLMGWQGFRPNATADKTKVFVEQFGCESMHKTRSGAQSTSVEALAQMADNTNDSYVKDLLIRTIDVNKEFSVVKGSKKVPDFVIGEDLHFSVEQIGYDGTARIYTKDFSVNQLPKPMRASIIPHDGKKFLFFDWSAAELGILFYWSKCKKGLEWYQNKEDIHTKVMQELLQKEEVSKEDRAVSKVLSFATCYGGNAFTIAKDLNISEDEGQEFLDAYNCLFPEIGRLRAQMVHDAHQNGGTKTIIGRFRKLPALFSSMDSERSSAERQVFNTAIQGSCADLQKIACYHCYQKYRNEGVRVAFQVFDSFLIEVPEDYSEDQCRKIADEMSEFSEFGIKLNYKMAVGYDWKTLQDLT